MSLGDKHPDTVMHGMRSLAGMLVRTRPVLRGMKLELAGPHRLHVQLRVAGHTRWEIQRDARKLIVMFLRRVFITPAALELELVTTERNGRELYLGEGRTPMTKRSRGAVQEDGTPWDDYEWWGDALPTVAAADEQQEERHQREATPNPATEDHFPDPPVSASPCCAGDRPSAE